MQLYPVEKKKFIRTDFVCGEIGWIKYEKYGRNRECEEMNRQTED